jgi:hypothetical protein
VNPFNFSWLIYGPGSELIAFVLNATVNHNKTPDLLKLWGYKTESVVCAVDSLFPAPHNFELRYALEQKRYTWRHDSVLATLQRPDIIIWSPSLRKVILIELTCPAEEGIINAVSASWPGIKNTSSPNRDPESEVGS